MTKVSTDSDESKHHKKLLRISRKYEGNVFYFFDEHNKKKIYVAVDCIQLILLHKLDNFYRDIRRLSERIKVFELLIIEHKGFSKLPNLSENKKKYIEELNEIKILHNFTIHTSEPLFFKAISREIRNALKKNQEYTSSKSTFFNDTRNENFFKNLNKENASKPNNYSISDMVEQILHPTLASDSSKILKKMARDNPIPLSDGQARLAYLDYTNPDFSPYNWLMSFQIRGEVNPSILEKCLRTLIRRHESLRTGIDLENKTQIILDPEIADTWDLQLTFDTQTDIKSFCRSFTQEKFDLINPPLMRSILIQTSSTNTPEYYWLCVIHHSVFDGSSQVILLKELATLYNAAITNANVNLDELLPMQTIQYADYSQWQDALVNRNFEDKSTFWQQELQDYEDLEFPTDFPRPTKKSFIGDRLSVKIPSELRGQLQKLAEENAVTLFTVLLSAFQIFLHRYTQQNDVCCGTMTSNRKKKAIQEDIKNTIGFIANSIVIRTKFDAKSKGHSVLQSVKNTIEKTIHENSDIPFGKVVETISPPYDASRNPLIETLFVFQDRNYQKLKLNGTDIQAIECGWGVSPFDLTLELREADDNTLCGFFDYNTNLFSENTMKRIAKNFETFLEDFSSHPSKRVQDFKIISSEENNLLTQWMENASPERDNLPIHHVMKHIAQKYPDKTALVFEDDSTLSFKELEMRANQLAHFLVEVQHIKPGDYVGICLRRSFELVIAILGAWKAGAAVICLETKATERQAIATKINLTKPQTIIVQTNTKDLIGENNSIIFENMSIEGCDTLITDAKNANPPAINSTANDLAMITFTSGTTSKNSVPKAILIKHIGLHNWINFYEESQGKFGIQHSTNVFLSLDIAFDAGVCEMFCQSLGLGATLFITSENHQFDAYALKNFFLKYNVQIAEFTPSLLTLFKPEDFPTLTHIVVVGEKFKKSLIKPWIEAGKIIINGYGPSETTIGTCLYICDIEKPIYIGKPICHTKARILDENFNPVPIGAWGELCISGKGLAKGYLNQPAQTAAAFVDDPFSTTDTPTKMYRTGDLVRWSEDGNIEFKGRIQLSRQIKLHGVRIELEEIENLLLEHPKIEKAIVIASGELEKQFISAFIVCKDDENINTSEIRNFLTDKGLATIKIPSVILTLEALPVTNNGKLDTKHLTKQAIKNRAKEKQISPQNEIESKLLAMWSQIFGYHNIGTNEFFREIGAPSILIILLISMINNEFFLNTSNKFAYCDLNLEQNPDFNIQQLAELIKNKLPSIENETGIVEEFENPFRNSF